MFNDKRILITGGTGTVGQELTRGLLGSWSPEEIVIFSRSEISQVEMKATFNDSRLNFKIGDIRDKEAVLGACKGIDYIFHLAAIKHIGICEHQPHEAIKTNILGAVNVINSAFSCGVAKVVNMSTDKAVNSSSSYGDTKAIAEKLFKASRYINIRSGNVFGSSGSVVPLFRNQVKNFNQILLTDSRMTRFFVSIRDIADFLLRVMRRGEDGNTYIMDDMKSFLLRDLAEIIIKNEGGVGTTIKETGARAGEKLHEYLYTENETIFVLSADGEVRQAGRPESSSNFVVSKEVLRNLI
jgi:FlaA1/EpsC-like NDP-sugar epimerase